MSVWFPGGPPPNQEAADFRTQSYRGPGPLLDVVAGPPISAGPGRPGTDYIYNKPLPADRLQCMPATGLQRRTGHEFS